MQQRHLAAILFTDIVGYTAMMQEDEAKAVSVVKSYHSILQIVVSKNSGKIINDYGDGSLCTFSSTIDAIRAALQIQEQLKKEQIPLRIGLHVGEILFEDGKVFGDGVNIASRIQSLGQANTILFSGEINSKIRNQSEFTSVSLGKFEFKNVDEPIEVFALSNAGLVVPKKEEMKGKLKDVPKKSSKILLPVTIILFILIATIFFYTKNKTSPKFTGQEKSIVVLPFVNMSTDKENEYFSDGMTEEITTQLSKISDLKVIARTSAMLFKGSKKSIKQISEELGVSAVLEGSVQKAGNTIKITAQLIDANTEEHIWADSYDRDLKDIFAIQSEVSQTIAYQLNANLTKDEKERIKKAPTADPEAYQYYLQGIQLHNTFWQTRKQEYFENSRSMFEKALSLDPNYSIAHAALADLYNTYTNIYTLDSLKRSEIVGIQLKEIHKAWELDSANDYVLNVRGVIEQTITRNKELGLKYLKKATEINPNPQNLWSLSLCVRELGLFDEAKLLLDQTVKIDPLTASNFSEKGVGNLLLNNLEQAKKDLETAIRLEPDFVWAKDNLARIYADMNMFKEANMMIEESLKTKPNISDHQANDLAYAYAKLGNPKKALELAPKDWGVLVASGKKTEALKALEDYYQNNKGPGTFYLGFKNMACFDPIRNETSFIKLLEKEAKIYEASKKRNSVMSLINSLSPSSETP